MDKTEIQIIIALHKPFPVPDDEMYLPLFVGAAERQPAGLVSDGRRGFTPDNSGDNISDQNYIYSELTGLYWAWKNLDAAYIGLVHYRRYFKEPHPGRRKRTEDTLKAALVWEKAVDDFKSMPEKIPESVVQAITQSVPQRIPEPVVQRIPELTLQRMPQPVLQRDLHLTNQRKIQDTAMEIGAEAFQWQDIADAGGPDYDFLNKGGFYTERILEEVTDTNHILWESYGLDYSKRLARVLTYESLRLVLAETDIILPRRRNYHIETLYSHYAHTHCGEHLDVTREIISQHCPEYVPAFDEVMQRTSAHMFNMMIMSRERLDEYCSWLFPILAELVERIDASGYDAYQARFAGRVSELMLDVWLEKCGYAYQELPMLMIGSKHWGKKIVSFLGAKFLGRRYRESY